MRTRITTLLLILVAATTVVAACGEAGVRIPDAYEQRSSIASELVAAIAAADGEPLSEATIEALPIDELHQEPGEESGGEAAAAALLRATDSRIVDVGVLDTELAAIPWDPLEQETAAEAAPDELSAAAISGLWEVVLRTRSLDAARWAIWLAALYDDGDAPLRIERDLAPFLQLPATNEVAAFAIVNLAEAVPMSAPVARRELDAAAEVLEGDAESNVRFARSLVDGLDGDAPPTGPGTTPGGETPRGP